MTRIPPVLARSVGGPLLYRLARLAGGPPPGLRRGRDAAPADVPVVVVVLLGVDGTSADALLRAAAAAQASSDTFTPVFLLDAPVLAPFRRAGYVVELTGPPGLDHALAEVRRSYAASAVVVLDATTVRAPQMLSAALTAVAVDRDVTLAERLRRRLRRLETALTSLA